MVQKTILDFESAIWIGLAIVFITSVVIQSVLQHFVLGFEVRALVVVQGLPIVKGGDHRDGVGTGC